MEVVIATTNPGKFKEVARLLEMRGHTARRPQEFGVPKIEVPETGTTLQENAALKWRAYAEVLPQGTIVLADDTGCEIAALNGEPGIYVRRWRDRRTEMTDQEVIAYALERTKDVPEGRRQMRMRTVVAVGKAGENAPQFADGSLEGELLLAPRGELEPGFPIEVIMFLPQLGVTLGELHRLSDAQKQDFLTHREKAVVAGLLQLR